MNVTEASRARHLVIRLDRGDELPASLLRALGEVEARAAWISGSGALEAAEIATMEPDGREARRQIEAGMNVLSLTGNAAIEGGALTLHLSATLARETDVGLALFGGKLVSGRADNLEIHVTVFDDLDLLRVPGEHGRSMLVGRKHASVLAPEPTRPSAIEPVRSPPPAAAPPRPSEPMSPPPQYSSLPTTVEAAVMPPKPAKPKEDLDVIYPELDDAVNHFAFGDCTVILSDGDRIRLRQDRDGRVREVALGMLKVEAQPDAPEGQRRFKLLRKN